MPVMAATLVLVVLLACHIRASRTQYANSSLSVSVGGDCGSASNQTCLGSTFGDCCSQKGWCGSTVDYCGSGCQSAFGSCSTNSTYISSDGQCGATDPIQQICIGSTYGSCCSKNGFCGNTSSYCGTGCQSTYGTCGGGGSTSTVNGSSVSQSSSTAAPTSTIVSSPGSQPSSAAASTMPVTSTIGFKVGIGVLAGVLGISIIVAVVFFLRRRSCHQRKAQQQHLSSELEGKHHGHAVSEVSSSQCSPADSPRDRNELPPMPYAELSIHKDCPAELGEKDVKGQITELPVSHS